MGKRTLDFPDKKELSNSLPLEFKVFVPSTRDYSKPISSTAFNKRITLTINFLTRIFGGSTIDVAQGTYRYKGKTIKEKVAIISVSTTQKMYNQYDEVIENWLKAKKKSWGQDSMGFVYKGKLVMV